MDLKDALHASLRAARAENLRRLDGLGEYDLRRPMTATGTNLLGVVKHLTGMEYGYLGETFGRRFDEPIPGSDDPWNNGDMWARADESAEEILDRYRRACALADTTVADLDLDAPGAVPHWPAERRATTLGTMIVRVLGEEERHGGHLDVVRELVTDRVEPHLTRADDPSWWTAYVARVQSAADAFR